MLEWIENAAGQKTYYYYDIVGRQLGTLVNHQRSDGTALASRTVGYLDLLGRVVEQRSYYFDHAPGAGWDWGDGYYTNYNAFGEVSSTTVNGSTSGEFHYDDAGRLWKSNSGDGVWKYFGYDAAGNQTIAIASAGANLTGKTLQQALALPGQSDVNATYTQYNKRGQALSVVEEGRQLRAGVTQNLTSSRSYNAFGEVLSETDALGHTTNYTYNNMGRVIKKESPYVSVTSASGAVSNVRPTENYYYDASGRLVANRDANNNLTRLTLLAGTGYDGSEALVTQELHADGGIRQTKYDRHGNARIMIDEVNRTTTQSFDAMGRVTQITKPGGLNTYYSYDGLGQRLTEWNSVLGSGNKQTADYDTQGRVISTRAFGGDVTNTSYTWNSALSTTGLGTFGGWTEVTTYANAKTLTESTDLFGRTTSRNDLGGNVQNYTYDVAARLTNVSGSNIGYTYFNTGQVSGQTGTGGTAIYKYDKSGNRTYEKLTKGADVLKDATISYDALNRMNSYNQVATSATPASNIAYQYDAHGNVLKTTTVRAGLDQNGTASGSYTINRWNRFDTMNRMVVAEGTLSGGTVVRGASGTDHLYDAAGQRVRSTQGGKQMSQQLWAYRQNAWSPVYLADNSAAIQQMYYDYDATGQTWSYEHFFTGTRMTIYDYDDAGQLEEVKAAESGLNVPTPVISLSGSVTAPVASQAGTIATYNYDNLGRLIDQQDKDGGSTVYHRQISYDNAKNRIASETITSLQPAGTTKAVNTYNYGSGASYALGQTTLLTTKNYLNGNDGAAADTSTTNSYIWRDGAIQSQTSFDPNTSAGGALHNSVFNYNAAGHLTTVGITDGDPRTVTYKTDETGQILQRKETGSNAPGNVRDIYTRFGAAELGRIGNTGTLNTDYKNSILNRTNGVADSGFQFGATQVTTIEGDFGQANDQINSYSAGTSNGSYTVRSGDTLRSVAANLWGDGNLWYKLAQANGLSGNQSLAAGTKLNVPHNVTRSSFHADSFKAYNPADALGDTAPTTPTPPKAAGPKCGAFGQVLLAAVAIAVTAVTAGSGAALGAQIGAAVLGSAVSQGVGLVTGIQDKFSFKGLAIAGISAGVTAGLGPKGLGAFGKLGIAGKGFAATATRGALSSAISQGIGVATGLQNKFSFAGVAAAGIGAATGQAIGGKAAGAGFGKVGSRVAATAASTIANAATRSAIDGSSFGDNIGRALPDAIGQLVGSVLGEELGQAFDRGNGDIVINQEAVRQATSGISGSLNNELFGTGGSVTLGEGIASVLAGQVQSTAGTTDQTGNVSAGAGGGKVGRNRQNVEIVSGGGGEASINTSRTITETIAFGPKVQGRFQSLIANGASATQLRQFHIEALTSLGPDSAVGTAQSVAQYETFLADVAKAGPNVKIGALTYDQSREVTLATQLAGNIAASGLGAAFIAYSGGGDLARLTGDGAKIDLVQATSPTAFAVGEGVALITDVAGLAGIAKGGLSLGIKSLGRNADSGFASGVDVVFNNGWRTADGKFASPLSGVRPGSSAEVRVWDAIDAKPGWSVLRGPVAVRDASGQLRYYDGVATSPSAKVIGLEVKSGGALQTGAQRTFDTTLNSSIFNTANGVGQSLGVTVQRTTLVRVPGS